MNSLSALHAIKQGILICDRSSRIIYFNDAYAEYIGVDLEEAKGHKLVEYRTKARAPEVVKTGIPMEGILRQEGDYTYYASVYPIVEDNEIRGSISIVTSIEQSKKQIMQKKGTLQERVKAFEKKEIQCMMSIYGSDVSAKRKIAKELGISLATLYNKLNME